MPRHFKRKTILSRKRSVRKGMKGWSSKVKLKPKNVVEKQPEKA